MRYRLHLLWQLTRRDISARYRGSRLGLLWTLVAPLILLAVYSFVFSVVFQARWGQGEQNKVFFALNLFAGMIVHGLLTETMARSCGCILEHSNYVKRVVFPLQLLPLTTLLSALFHALVSLGILLLATTLTQHSLHWQLLALPVVLVPVVLYAAGLGWLLAALGTFIRDLGQVMPMLATILLFTAPVFFPISALPEQFQGWLTLNPLTSSIEMLRGVLFAQQLPSASQYAHSLGTACLMLLTGYFVFNRLRPGFADAV